MRRTSVALLAGAIILAPLAVPTASHALTALDPIAVPDTESRTFTSLLGSDVAADPRGAFGYAVATDGATLVVGARYQETQGRGSGNGDGAIFVYTKAGTTWSFLQRIDAPAGITAPQTGARFGQSVAVQGDTIAVGAPYETRTEFDPDQASAGAAYVYTRSGATWSAPPVRLVDPGSESLLHDTRFGSSIALSAGTLAVGGPGKYLDNLAGQDKAGVVVAFSSSGSGWDSGTVLMDSTPTPKQEFGTSVGLVGSNLLVGIPRGITAAGATGRVATFTKAGSWIQGADANPAGLVVGDAYGSRMTTVGSTALIAALSAFPALTFPNYPQVSRFDLAGGSWNYVSTLTATNPGPAGAFAGDSYTLDTSQEVFAGQAGAGRVDIWGPPVPLSTPRNTPLVVSAPGVIQNDWVPSFPIVAFRDVTVTKVTDPAHGAVTLNPDGGLRYTPDANFVGTDSFTYQVQPPEFRPADLPTPSAPTTVTFVVTPTYDASYAAGPGGTVSGTTFQVLSPGQNATPVTAVPNAGWRFVRWSDGVTTASRTDTNVTANISVTAQFEQIQLTLTYLAGALGSVTGTSPQTVFWGASGTAVTAVPAQGARFVKWSDGLPTATRTDTNVQASLTVTAQFEQVPLDLKATAVSSGSKFKLQVLASCTSQFTFTLEKRHKKTVYQGSDEPVVTITWKKRKGSYKTSGASHTRTVNLPKGTYRAVVSGNCGYLGATSDPVSLKR